VTHVKYNFFPDLTFSSHSLFINLNNECSVLVTVTIFVCTWTLKLSFRFSQTLSYHTHVFDFMIMLLSRIIIWLSVVLWLSKCINSDFESSNCTAFFFAHVKAIFAAFFSVFTFLSIFFFFTVPRIKSRSRASQPIHFSPASTIEPSNSAGELQYLG